MHFDILDEYVILKQIILVALIHKKKVLSKSELYTQTIIQFPILINSIRIAGYSILGALYAKKKNYVSGERGEALGHLADGEMAFRVKACSRSGRIERPSSSRRQSGYNVYVLQARNFSINRTRVVSCLRRPDSNC